MNVASARAASMLVVALAAALLGAACATKPPQRGLPTGPDVGDQDLSSFYRWNETLPPWPGLTLREEPIKIAPEFAAAASAMRVLYTSTDGRWQTGVVPVSGTLYLPKGKPPAGGWPLIAWAHGTLGVADVCAPSWAGHKPRDATYINRWLGQGFAVAATDYQGLGGPGPHPYLIWEAEGRSVLDSARAALQAHRGVIANVVFITGQSQGSGAALGATRIAPDYAPELKLRGTIATGVITSFPDGPYRPPAAAAPGSGAPHFTIMRMIGGSLPDDGPSVDRLVSERGRPLLDAARKGCSPDVSALARNLKVDNRAAFTESPEAIGKLLLPVLDMPVTRMTVPVLLGTGLADRLVPPKWQYNAVAALCAAGSQVTWHTYASVTHNGSVNAAFDDALAFVNTLLAGQRAPGNCASVTEPGDPGAADPGIPFND
jgi:hypothetical protein